MSSLTANKLINGLQTNRQETLTHILKNQPSIWRAANKNSLNKKLRFFSSETVLPTAYPELDRILHYGGWPRNALSEVALPNNIEAGIGEVRLLLPALANLLKQHYAIWIAPPFLPYAPALMEAKLNTNRLIIIDSNNLQDSLWSAEQAIKSGAVKAVFTWLNKDTKAISTTALRRLHIASKAHKCWTVLFRKHADLNNASPAALRMSLQPHSHSKLSINIIKQPGGWAGQSLDLSLVPHYENWQRLPIELLPSYTQNKLPTLKTAKDLTNGISSTNVSSASITDLKQHAKSHSV